MKLDKKLKIALIILLIIFISIISFVGIYIQDKNTMKDIVKEYALGMDLEGSRVVGLIVDESTETIYYDKDGNVVDEETKAGKKEQVRVNSEEILTKENYLTTKNIIEKRLNDLGIADYLIRQDEKNGKMVVQLPEDSRTSLAIQYLYTVGKFTVEDEDGEILLDNSNLKDVKVGYGSTTTGTRVYLNIEFNKDSIEKVKEISNTYVTTTDDEGNETTKKVNIKIDDSTLTSTSFSEEIANGVIPLSIGSATTDNTTLNSYLQEASNLAILLNNGQLPIAYNITQNRYVQSDITAETIVLAGLITAVVIIIALLVFIIKYRKNGALASVAYIGYVAVFLLTLRYANVLITTEGLFGILIAFILNYIFTIYLLKLLKNEENNEIGVKKAYSKGIISMILILIPATIVGITLCFSNWLPMYSFGAIIFWGILLILVYNTILTRTLLVCGAKKE